MFADSATKIACQFGESNDVFVAMNATTSIWCLHWIGKFDSVLLWIVSVNFQSSRVELKSDQDKPSDDAQESDFHLRMQRNMLGNGTRINYSLLVPSTQAQHNDYLNYTISIWRQGRGFTTPLKSIFVNVESMSLCFFVLDYELS